MMTAFPQARIVGGHEVEFPRKYPFTVSLVKDGSHFCGGTLIDSDVVLTAAHCMVFAEFDVQIGVHARSESQTDACVETIPVSSFVNHEMYNDETLENDIALVYLTWASSYPLVVGISESPPLAWEAVSVAGWGTLTAGGSSPDILNEAEVYYFDREFCIQRSEYSEQEILPGMSCAWHPSRDACQGDSGGPLFRVAMNDSNPAPFTFHLVGVVSWGVGCANIDYPGVYADVAYYIPWLQENLAKTSMVFGNWTPPVPTVPDLDEPHDDDDSVEVTPCVGGSATADTGTFAHPDVPGATYLNDENCTFEISVTEGKHIELNFTRFRVEKGWDFLNVFEGIGANKVLIARLTGSDLDYQGGDDYDYGYGYGDGEPQRRLLLSDVDHDHVPRQFLEHFQWLQQQIEQATSEAHKGMLRVQLQKGRAVARSVSAHRRDDGSLPPLTYPWDPIVVSASKATLHFTSDFTVVDEGFSVDWKAFTPVCGPEIPNVFVLTTTPGDGGEPTKQLVTDACVTNVLDGSHEICTDAEQLSVDGQTYHVIRNMTGTNPGDPLTPDQC